MSELESEKQHWYEIEEERRQLEALRAEDGDLKMSSGLEHRMQIIREHSSSVVNCSASQIHLLRLENQQLKAALRQAELRLSTMEREKACQQVALSEQICSVHQLREQNVQCTQLKEERDALTVLLSHKNGELEQQNLELKTKLQSVRAELSQIRSSLRTLEGADGHGLKVALGMQKQITAKREQIDFLQVQIQLLEENIERLKLEKHQQALEVKRQTQELMSEREIRRTLEAEVEASHSQERELKSKAERLKRALYKMSDSFAECQDFIQMQEQEIMRLKLQHALNMKELQSQNLRNVSRSPVSCAEQASLRLPQHVNGLMELGVCDPIVHMRSFMRELPGGTDEKHGADTGTVFRRRSEEDHKSRPLQESKDTECSRRPTRKITSYSEPSSLRTAEPDKQNHNSSLSAHNNTLDLRAGRIFCGSRSPVHALLTSDLPADRNCRLNKPLTPSLHSTNNWSHYES